MRKLKSRVLKQTAGRNLRLVRQFRSRASNDELRTQFGGGNPKEALFQVLIDTGNGKRGTLGETFVLARDIVSNEILSAAMVNSDDANNLRLSLGDSEFKFGGIGDLDLDIAVSAHALNQALIYRRVGLLRFRRVEIVHSFSEEEQLVFRKVFGGEEEHRIRDARLDTGKLEISLAPPNRGWTNFLTNPKDSTSLVVQPEIYRLYLRLVDQHELIALAKIIADQRPDEQNIYESSRVVVSGIDIGTIAYNGFGGADIQFGMYLGTEAVNVRLNLRLPPKPAMLSISKQR